MAKRTLRRIALLAATLALFCAALIALPAAAHARSLEVQEVQFHGSLNPDGSMYVIEQRTYTFDGSFDGIIWDIPRGDFEGRTIEPAVALIGVSEDERVIAAFDEGDGETPGTYSVTKMEDCLRVKLSWPVTDKTLSFQMVYSLPQLASRWADTAELYWRYVPADESSQEEWKNIKTVIYLPIPEGETMVPGENVRAWGHGPLDGEVSFEESNRVVFNSPGVGTHEFLEARVTFPASWLHEAPALNESKLDEILTQETRWAASANANRFFNRHKNVIICGAMLLTGLSTFGLALAHSKGFRFRKKPKASFDEKYLRDVPSSDHPAVLGALYNDGKLTSREFAASLMRLADKGWLAIEPVTFAKQGAAGSAIDDFRITRLPSKEPEPYSDTAENLGIDNSAYAFIFDTVADAMGDKERLFASSFEDMWLAYPARYEFGIRQWAKAVERAYTSRGFEQSVKRPLGGNYPGILGVLDFIVAVIALVAGVTFKIPLVPLALGVIALCAVGVFCIMRNDESDTTTVPSREAVELKAKLGALKRWLEDFTRLEEAVPTDVVLWNRLLIMATALGVADKVVSQLKTACPELLENPDFTAAEWYQTGDGAGRAALASTLENGVHFEAARTSSNDSSTSTSERHDSGDISRTRDSSSTGSGGGFSRGGGGGFGGGGRGGAF